jgi:DNA-binding XRE family transcriptional regulator
MSNADEKNRAIGERLRMAREQAGLSQGQVAKKLNLHRPSVTETEAGRRKASPQELVEYASTGWSMLIPMKSMPSETSFSWSRESW